MKDHIYYRDGYKYQLVNTYVCTVAIQPASPIDHDYIRLDTDGTLTIRRGYAWDGPSGPTFDSKNFMRGSLVHDALYQLIGEGLLPLSDRALADEELRRICSEDGMSTIRAWWVYQGVHWFGDTAASSPEKAPIEAP